MGDCEEKGISFMKAEESPSSNVNAVQTVYGNFQNLKLDDTENPEVNLDDTENPEVDLDDTENPEVDLDDTENPELDPAPKEEWNSGGRSHHHPLRPGEPDCSFYLRMGMCRFGSNCRFNHPPRRKNKVGKDKENEKENENEKAGQLECKYYLKTGGCKFGKSCRYNHPQEKAVEGELLELNFLGLPIRPGERECPFYMRTGSCKFAANCRFHHPDPTAVGGCDLLSGYHNDRTLPLHTSAALQAPMTSWSLQRASNESVPYMDASPPYVPMMPLPPGVHPNPEWNGYQVPVISTVFPPKRNVQPPSASVVNDLIKEADNSTHQQKTTVDEFPERPGQPDCQYFMRNGDCKFRSACRYHHPKTRASKSSVCDLSPMGLPLRPDQVICTYYSRYGICKFGPACKFDHPINKGYSDSPTSPVVTAPASPPSYEPLMSKLDRVPDCGNSSDDLS
ncbi:zinc finger CCCH domain-containing protein 67-like isoform X2 [Magnolia sinica]|uniref:zinc finger CCCH domain-containing protein 67-like isoform X2 n=1 Tax=Magnolia sinica TaxID=86752 RepID=UPI00265B0304|nr:zinc finger CCCH domain-containing protein 67-like isoform X2 [Magnolia sinica]